MRKVFYSFEYKPDNWRVSQIRNMGLIEGNKLLNDNKWEEVKRQGDGAIQKWIDENLKDKSCTIVLIGASTANRKWINYEIEKTWNSEKGIFGIHIHKLLCSHGNPTSKGQNPFRHVTYGYSPLSNIVDCYDPPQMASKDVYTYISTNIETWVENAIVKRNTYR